MDGHSLTMPKRRRSGLGWDRIALSTKNPRLGETDGRLMSAHTQEARPAMTRHDATICGVTNPEDRAITAV